MNKQELFELMKTDPQHKVFNFFGDLPDSLKVPDVLDAWITHVDSQPGCGADDAYAQIKSARPDLVTDRIRILAVGLSPTTLHQIKPEETPAYKEIALLAISKSAKGMMFLDKQFHTDEMLKEIFEQSPDRIDLSPKYQHWIRPLITPEMKGQLIETNLRFALSLDEKDVSREQWQKLLTENPLDYPQIELRKRLSVLVDFLKDGGWPASRGSLQWKQVDSVADALTAFVDAGGSQPWSTLYKAKVQTFPIEDVLSATDHHSKIPDLIKIYPDAVLRKNMKHNRALRAHLLENDLGM